MILIVGLGNPGVGYVNTRHNIGYVVIDEILRYYFPNCSLKLKEKFYSYYAICNNPSIGQTIVCKPNTFMNLSGKCILSIVSYYKIKTENVLIIHDDIDLSLGKLKYKFAGSSGGHNGLKSIDSVIGNKYSRIRVGIGRPDSDKHDIADYVLGQFSTSESTLLLGKIQLLVQNLKLLYSSDIDSFKSSI